MGAIQFFLIMFLIAGAIITTALITVYVSTTKKTNSDPKKQLTSADWINVKDITQNEILTLDGKAISLFRIKPINTHLMTVSEKKSYISKITGDLSGVQTPYKLLSVPSPFDVQPFVDRLETEKETATDTQKFIIQNEINALNDIAKSGTVIEKIHYLVFWDNPEDIEKSRNDFIKQWDDAGGKTTLLNRQELMCMQNTGHFHRCMLKRAILLKKVLLLHRLTSWAIGKLTNTQPLKSSALECGATATNQRGLTRLHLSEKRLLKNNTRKSYENRSIMMKNKNNKLLSLLFWAVLALITVGIKLYTIFFG